MSMPYYYWPSKSCHPIIFLLELKDSSDFFWLLNPHIRLSYIFKPYVNPECAAHMQRFGIKRRQGLKVTSTKTKEPILETLFFFLLSPLSTLGLGGPR